MESVSIGAWALFAAGIGINLIGAIVTLLLKLVIKSQNDVIVALKAECAFLRNKCEEHGESIASIRTTITLRKGELN